MDPTNTITPTRLLETAQIIPIAKLCPDLPDPSTKAVGGVVTITWPYNKVKGTFAFNLAEPDFRLRRNKGQVRIDFTGKAAEAVGDSGLGGNDEILLSLEGAAWEAEDVDRRRSLPGSDLGWRLVFCGRLTLRIKRAETGETDLITVDERSDERPDETRTASDQIPIQPSALIRSPSPVVPLSPVLQTPIAQGTNTTKSNEIEFASPAFIKRARMSYGALFEGGFDIFQEDSNSKWKGPKRTRFGQDGSSWRYASRSPSPDLAAASPKSTDEQLGSPARAVYSSREIYMVNEGSQTTEVDQPSPQPIKTGPDTQVDETAPKAAILEDVPVNIPSSSMGKRTQTPPLHDWLPEPTGLNPSMPNPHGVAPPEPGVPFPLSDSHSDQQPIPSSYDLAGNPWSIGLAPPAFEPQEHLSSSFRHGSFPSSDVDNIEASHQSIPFGEVQEPVDHAVMYSAEQTPSGTNYPPLDPNEDATPQSVHDEALTNYPTSYLEGDGLSEHGQMMEGQPPHAVVAELRPNSWATINQSYKATTAAPTDRLGSRNGSTPEQAFVIEESDTGSDSEPEPMAVEDTVNSGRAYTLGMYEDAEAEDEVDAQYSDDDEPEYDAEEMGGDYDTRNYEQPGDDDEGSLDEDLQPPPLESEFDDGASWDEEEQEEFLDEENEGEYETDEDIPKSSPQPAVRANPMVIDLISSSEDESEDGDEYDGGDTNKSNERSSAHIDSRVVPDHQQTNLEDEPRQVRFGDEEAEIISQASVSEAPNSSDASQDGEECTSIHEEGDRELKFSRSDANQPIGLELGPELEAGPEDIVVFGEMQGHIVTSYGQTVHKEISENPSVPLSAADGLEILSRTVNKESDARNDRLSAEPTVENIGAEQPAALSRDETDIQLLPQDLSAVEEIAEEHPTQSRSVHEADLLPFPKPDTTHPPITNDKYPAATASSPSPSNQALPPRIEDNRFTVEGRTATSTAELVTTQFPTVVNTQTTDTTLNASISTSANIGESFESYTTVEQQQYQTRESSIDKESPKNLVQMDNKMSTGEDSIEQESQNAPIIEPQQLYSSGKSSTTSSPARSFQTQVDNTEVGLSDSVEETKHEPQILRRLSSQSRADASDASGPFTSHMDVDEELQASILEDFQLENQSDYEDGQDDDEESFRIDMSDAYTGPNEEHQADTASSPHENTPAKQLAEDISAQLKRNFMANSDSSGEESDASTRNDSSVHLARVLNASKRRKRKRAASTDSYRPSKRLFDSYRSRTPETDDSSILLARASLASHTPRSEEDSYSMTAAKLQLARHLRDELPDCTSLKVLRQHLTKSLDVIAVAVMQPPDPQRAKGGPREFMMSFTVADHSIGPYAVAEALIYRPHKDTLPVVRYGDIVLLRNFSVVSLANKGFGLRSNESSSWAVFDYEGEPPQIRGPPVEYSERETLYVSYLREWFGLLDVKAREKLETANKKIINSGKT
ncbi:hypothetical protein F5B22DRAFT_590241 [Xylaria bambusicola]|uniref:uncharacterized protein n=1 Tax=Xylaria bambusicola TaxID=326684 RepID=UPI0020077738|nr:uncharacterized protein F5B22DRAFT_590241 [Xylaria bambusicola]KAI0525509.1 hypothetical protein F5B22DRAFT_590241 [Xylaria bambusicola]